MNDAAAIRARVRLARAGFLLDLDFSAPARGITGILGPSGSGKTTLLRCIAGLEREGVGSVAVAGTVWQDAACFVLPHERAVGFVFQDARLFPHLSVHRNLEYGRRRSADGTGVGLDEVIELLGLGALMARKPPGLSAGEAQRVAIGRALLRKPRVVLMDEPLANLDPARRQEILPYLERLHARLTIPILYVSHGIDEVIRLCDHLVLLQAGRVHGAGSVQDVLAQPELVAALGEEFGTILQGTVRSVDANYELTDIDTDAGRILVPGHHGAPGQRLRLRIQARDVSLAIGATGQSTILNVLPAVVESVRPQTGGYVDLELRVGTAVLLSRISRRSSEALGLRPGSACHAQVKGVAVKGAALGPLN
ncbi:MAG TPA: molybdenum ABC transporter ATP-binding protein [Verrucomicrobiae bacterium]|nr:molybdenum ABC transporter ATP-binding protein [Verrucomicrobiae bacterium]